MAQYNPKAVVDEVLPAGIYDAVVKKATNDVSKGGNEMIKLMLEVYTPTGIAATVWDYLVFTDSVLYKVKHFCESAGIDFDKGELEGEECVDQNVRVKLVIDEQEGYAPKNAVKDYMKRNGATVPVKKPEKDPLVPF